MSAEQWLIPRVSRVSSRMRRSHPTEKMIHWFRVELWIRMSHRRISRRAHRNVRPSFKESESNQRPQGSNIVDALEYDLTAADSDTDSLLAGASKMGTTENIGRAGEQQEVVAGQLRIPSNLSEEEVLPRGESEFIRDILFVPQRRSMAPGFASLDMVELEEQVYEVRALAMKSVPNFVKGAFRRVLKISLEEILRVQVAGNEEVTIKGWKLFFLLPRMLLCRLPRRSLIPRKRLEERLATFTAGELGQFGGDVVGIGTVGSQAQFRRRRRGRNQDVENRAARALHFTQMVELSFACQALEACPVAPGDESTRAKK